MTRVLVRQLRERGLTLGVAESCTGGLLCAAITNVPGSSTVLRGGLVAYSDDAKQGLLGVRPSLLRLHGAVSKECASAMARGAQAAFGADVGIAVTGIAGPGGAVPGKPVGTVWFAIAGPGRAMTTRKVHFPGTRSQVRRASVRDAVALLLEHLDSGR